MLVTGPENFTEELASSFHSLVTDRKVIVRRTICYGFHEVGQFSFPPSADTHSAGAIRVCIGSIFIPSRTADDIIY